MITQEEFADMPEVQQALMLLEQGRVLLSVKKQNYLFKLYALADFCVEIRYDYNNNSIIRVSILTLSEVLDLYGDEINITDAFSMQ